MPITQFKNSQVKDKTLTLDKLEDNFLDNKTWILSTSNTAVLDGLAAPTGSNQPATKNYVDSLVDSNMKSPDGYATNAAGDYPTDYKGTGTVSEGDSFYITDTTNGTTVGTVSVNVGDLLLAKVDNPGNDDANWLIMESNRDQATEDVKGVAEIATQTEVDTGTDDTKIVTPLKLATYVSDNSTVAGAGLTKTGTTIDVNATDASLVINADDMAVQRGTTNGGASLEVTATGLEVTTSLPGPRALGTAANDAIVAAQPDGTVDLAIATTKYVNDQISTATQEVYGEAPAVTDGSADVTLANTPIADTERVYLNGARQNRGSSNDYTLSGNTITFADTLTSGDVVVVDYKY